jgi:predicted DNA-binding WGR domain protein
MRIVWVKSVARNWGKIFKANVAMKKSFSLPQANAQEAKTKSSFYFFTHIY